MADEPTGLLSGIRKLLLDILVTDTGAGSEQPRKGSHAAPTTPPAQAAEPDRGDLGEGRGRVLYIRA